MRLMVGQSNNDRQAVHALAGDRAINLTAKDESIGPDLGALVRNASTARDRVQALLADTDGGVAVGSIMPSLPLKSCGKIICLGLNYVDHAKEGGYDVPDYPALFIRAMTSMIPAGGRSSGLAARNVWTTKRS